MSVALRAQPASGMRASCRDPRCGPATLAVAGPRARACRQRATTWRDPAPRGTPPPRRGAAPPAAVAEGAAGRAVAALPPLPPLDASYEPAVAFGPYASWLAPGVLMAGRYPYVDGTECTSYDQGEAMVEAIVTAGPHVFVSLEAELPPQRAMPIGGQGGVAPYKAVVELMAAAHTPPPPGEVVNGVRNPTLDQFLPQRKKAASEQVAQYYEAERVAFEHWPLEEGAAPSPQQLAAAVAAIGQRLSKGEKVYIHSRRGGGRAAVVGACLLAAAYGLGADEALERARRAYEARGAGAAWSSAVTEQQREAVRRFLAGAKA